MSTTIESPAPVSRAAGITHVQPYLNFQGRCEEALEFYRRVLGAEITALMRFRDSCPGGEGPPVPPDKIMHASLRIGESMILASDCNCAGEQAAFQGFSLSLTAADDDAAERLFGALADGGKVMQPLITTFFASRFGVVTDRFGVSWMVVCLLPQYG
jgi:PhnB protein